MAHLEICFFHENSLYRWPFPDDDYEDGVIHAERLDFHPGAGEWEESADWEEFDPVEVLALLTEKLSGVTEAVKAQHMEHKHEIGGMYRYLSRQIRNKREGAENAP